MKKIALFVLLFSIVLSMICFDVSAATSGRVGSCAWSIEDGVLTISGYGSMGNGGSWPWSKDFTKLVVEEGVTEIGKMAFQNCTSLIDVELPSTLKTIGMYAFDDCTSLVSIDIPDGVKTIEYDALSGCSSLEEINVDPDNATYTSVDGILFSKDMTTLIKYPSNNKHGWSYEVPDSVKVIEQKAFFDAWLFDVKLPDGLERIGMGAFVSTSIMNSIGNAAEDGLIYVDNYLIGVHDKFRDASSYDVKKGTKLIAEGAFIGCDSATHIYLPNSVAIIGENAFWSCAGLESISIPAEVKKIGEYAFLDCGRLENIYYRGSEKQQKKISVSDNNEELVGAKWHYDACYYSAEHAFGEYDIKKEATCDIEGKKERSCTVCSKIERESIPSLGHSYGEWDTKEEPTCVDLGREERECISCGAMESRDMEPVGHTFGEWTSDNAHICTQLGQEIRVCTACEEKEIRDIEPVGHTFGEWKEKFAPTCKEEGTEARVCLKCSFEETRSAPVLEHKFGDFEVLLEPTVEKEGVRVSKCELCNESKNESIPRLEEPEKSFSEMVIVILAVGGVLLVGVGAVTVVLVNKAKNNKK